LTGVRQLCDQNDWLLITDEIQSGMGRTGKWFAAQHEDVVADVITVAKALGNGFPIGACLAKGSAAELIQPGSHGTTFGGNPLGCRVGLNVINQINENQLLDRASELGDRLSEGFKRAFAGNTGVVSIRGKGLMIGIELAHDCTEIVKQALDAGLLINVTAARVIRLLPAYIMTDEEADDLVNRLSDIICNFLSKRETEEPVSI